MPLTPDDIQEKFFRTALRGYHLEDVDEFLDEVALSLKEYEELLAERDRIIAEMKRRPPAADTQEAGRALSQARADARRIIEEARESASQLVAAARNEAASLSQTASGPAEAAPAVAPAQLGEVDRRRERAAQLMLAEIERYRIVMSVVKSTVTGLPGAMDDHMAELDQAAAQIRSLL
ncbi:MAG: DivIVA domain-containing protein [bacterium]|nr:DivIVA domain-containing protein [Acidimicrobiia bacterium]MCY4650606.1 DivIVA domain-containing protein [bacterium]